MIISIPAEKKINKFQHSLKTKNSTNEEQKGIFSNWQREYKKPIANIIVNGERLKTFLPKSGTSQGCLPSPLLFNTVLEVLPLLLSHFSRVQLCVTPQTGVHQVPLSLGFSRQEHWSGLTFPSPMHDSEKSSLKSTKHENKIKSIQIRMGKVKNYFYLQITRSCI